MLQKILPLLLVFNLVVSLAFANPPQITAEGAIVIEAKTGRVIYEKNADARLMPASTTKVMTGILALEHSKLSDRITISANAVATEDQYIPYAPNDVVDMENALRGMLLVSDNGSAVAIAEHISGSVAHFARLMNSKAKEIGCTDTNFVTPNGLPNPNHLTTARDMAKITAYAMKKREFRDIVASKNLNMFWVSPQDKTLPLENTNKLLWTFKGINGVKTGWTSAAQGCLSASAKRRDVELIAVVLKSADTETRFSEAANLLDYGFSKVTMVKGPAKDTLVRRVFVHGGKTHLITVMPKEDIVYPLIDGDTTADYSTEYNVPRIIDAPVKVGDKVGELIVKYKNKPIGKIDVVANMDAAEGFSFLSFFYVGLLKYFSK